MKIRLCIRLFIPFCVCIVLGSLFWRGLNNDPHAFESPLIGKSVNTLLAPASIPEGQVSLVNIFASWCMSCLAEQPFLVSHARELAQAHIQLYAVNYKDQKFAVDKWLKKNGNPFKKIIYDADGKIGINLGVYGVPETLIVDTQGTICAKYVGPVTETIWQQKIVPLILLAQHGCSKAH